jgi:hypothetical protein
MNKLLNGVLVPLSTEEIAKITLEREAEALRTQQEVVFNIKQIRNKLLFESDWTQVYDAPVNKLSWAAYRQLLRDLPQQEGFPNTVVWPTVPQEVNDV